MKTRPPCNAKPRVNVSIATTPEFAIELDQIARRHGTNRHQLILTLVKEGVARLLASDTASQQQS